MSSLFGSRGLKSFAYWLQPLRRVRRDESGATTVEFAIVVTPFLMMTFGIFGLGIYYFTQFSLENAIDTASRAIRTGTYRTAVPGGMSSSDFKKAVCDLGPSFIKSNCSKLRVFVVTIADENAGNAGGTGFSGAVGNRPSCGSNGQLGAENSNNTKLAVGASTIVLVLGCYQFDLAASLPYLTLGAAEGQSAIIQASTVFRTEPF